MCCTLIFVCHCYCNSICQFYTSSYVTLTINGGGYTALSNPLENGVVYSGSASSVSGSTISTSFSMTSGEVSTSDLKVTVLITYAFRWNYVDITSNTESALTLAVDVSSLVSAEMK